ncbi:MAG: ATP-dependent RNA helicase RhlB [Cycloclasticus pugetii]|uniref:ATP-dependent RNA helicase RhlB n=1 Tax=Cycloclasticus TaxID=34067 RepID=UPI002580461C|nr:ATP-dependent RNA helicase RhlB [Cycloclasticus sp.]MBV1899153.1 ATP-dependent RNA helicase RhlB [Cycloclasticus sp.]
MSDTHLTDTQFSSLGLTAPLIQGLDEANFIKCTPIQEQTLPISLLGNDVAGQAQTGTGKTIAFLLATYHTLLTKTPADNKKGVRALILAPTRELAIQIANDAKIIGKHTDIKVGLAYGGTDYDKQRKTIEDGVDILIGTPGRTIDFFKQKVFNLRNTEVLVLDEADRMFDLGFINDIRYLLRRLPKPEKRLNLLFSATLSFKVTELAYEHMNNPVMVRVEPEQITAKQVVESVYYPADNEKIPLLLHLLTNEKPERGIIFINTKHTADRLHRYLKGNDFDNAVLSGDVPQKKRQAILTRFQDGKLPLLIATDVAARGLHIPAVSHVFNFDLPQDAEDYVHRIGRTARSGASGKAISFACETYAYSLPDIEAYISHKIPFENIDGASLPDVKPATKRTAKPSTHKRPANARTQQKSRSHKR